ncbi:putative S-adenosylmethionine-dependent methyltransferase/MSMEI_2290 [Gemmata obscuriglobus]|uniref:Class I SAM-dependent methyltransferase n=1 Tax=Gemmata obscuriglobus TaxID=114 RepID=A0A2Z3GXX7_9BACT|nr:class I SAM-dependent methyltransferase [Gemmata obscuriglobus]AWM39339.1 class I SAM-dependent methyltransferase [Gemmata obscuriglobus]QEG27595.1 putative S-adenosylmethionine-dependent methyltransferase/MSMEI_2290 [Gemmata obscuriglobus]VTS04711.1 Methyltransferase type 12 OS=Planctomyces limnophilus (strain ATCC 43296 / DSM 3776 / IFAM 1008 / 290) GN=Plim_2682 PE=4 SV=1: Methyltransf_23 [Gemmata obscuriglobus UQM 2246]
MMNRPPLAIQTDSVPAPARASAVAWDESPCPLCGSDADPGPPVLEAPDPLPPPKTGLMFAVVRCRRCALVFTNPRPSERAITRFYPPDYEPHRRPRQPRRTRRARPLLARLFGRPCAERRGALPWPGPGRLLDFGCGTGGFLKTMADRGWAVTGLDSCPGVIDAVRTGYGLPALVGSLPHPDLAPGSFDVVTMWHSLEHIHRPLELLREAFKLLIPGGKLVVATPNIESAPYRLFGPAWFGLDLPRHLTHFAPGTLTAMLQAAGFRAAPVRQFRHSDWLRMSARRAAAVGAAGPFARLLQWKPAARLAAWACYLAGSSDCMVCVAERPA